MGDLANYEYQQLGSIFTEETLRGYIALNYLHKCAQDLLLQFDAAATRIQARARGIKSRKLVAEKKQERQKHLSATKIQKSYRGKKGRDAARDRRERLAKPITTDTGHLAAASRDDEVYAMVHHDSASVPPPPPPSQTPVKQESKASPQTRSTPGTAVTSPGAPAGSAREAVTYFRNDVSGVLVTEQQIRSLWSMYDVDGNGFLDKEEVKRIYSSFDTFGVADGDRRVDNVLSKYNVMGDGKVSYEEFAILILDIARR
eukprot:TRINITY_DN4064_c0_g1_i1.p1 TRINITY_DN4064_c0_g1~~TRINITY_DN4064_c0_g1_i1.p1  ORF type:complete len:258 (+),score=89.30 TRINITY_DN4064_c0_g1_i1:126-899(+)